MYKVLVLQANNAPVIEAELNSLRDQGMRPVFVYTMDSRIFMIMEPIPQRGRPSTRKDNEETSLGE